MQKECKPVNSWWFNLKARALVEENYPAKHLPLNQRWFQGFCRRYKISLWRKTHAAQKSAAALRTAIEKFYAKSLQEHKRVTFTIKDLGNMDQTLVFFVIYENRTYENTGADDI